ncbi:MAG: cytidine deaminase [Candidatus Kariarchaeaceae archaeon]
MDIDLLVKNSINSKDKAYAPYSNFKVGAALLSTKGEIYQGCNIENISFTPTVCAERTAFFTAIIDGEYDFKAIAVATDDEKFSPPCGVCRQVMAEFVNKDFIIILVNNQGQYRQQNFEDIFPFPFTPTKQVGKKKV